MSRWEISLPDPHNPGMFTGGVMYHTQEEALKEAKTVWGADEEGRVSIVNEISGMDDEDDEDEDWPTDEEFHNHFYGTDEESDE